MHNFLSPPDRFKPREFKEFSGGGAIDFFLTRTQSGTPIEISLCYFNNFNHPQRE